MKIKTIKSKHAHNYIEVLLLIKRIFPFENNEIKEKAYRAFICPYCGKIKNIVYMEAIEDEKGKYYYSPDRDYMLEKYSNLIRFDLGDTVYKHLQDIEDQKYINIRDMYVKMILTELPSEYKINDEYITEGLIHSIQPEKMVDIIMRRQACAPKIRKEN